MKIGANMLLVIDEKKEEQKVGSIIIPSTTKDPIMKGVVNHVGQGTPELPMVYEVGDTVIFNPAAGSKVPVGDVIYRLIDIREIKLAL